MIAAVCCAAGAADACMNTRISAEIWAQYLAIFNHYDARAKSSLHVAVEKFAEKISAGEHPDVLPLYVATFIYAAASVRCQWRYSGLLLLTRCRYV